MAQAPVSELLLPVDPTAEEAQEIRRSLDLEQGRTTPASPPAGFPRDRIPATCVARFELLSQLVRHLERWEQPVASAVLTGPPGIGKTTLAAEYLRRRRGFYDRLGWVTAQPADTAAADLDGLAGDLDLECVPAGLDADLQFAALAEAVLGALRRGQPRRVLLVIDDLDHLQPATVEDVWQPPTARAGRLRLLLTSRLDAGWQQARQLTVGLPTPQAAAAYLRQQTGSQPVNPEDPADVLAAELGYHPEKLERAVANIGRAGCSIASYLDLARELKAQGRLGDLFAQPASGSAERSRQP